MIPENIIEAVEEVTGVTFEKIKTDSRKREIIQARKLIIHYIDEIIPEPKIIAYLLNKSVKCIYDTKEKIYEDMRRDKTLKFLKSECDKILNGNSDN